MICGIDYKACEGCGLDEPIESFIRNNYETDYCADCRKVCVCGDWVGVCGGECKPPSEEMVGYGRDRDEWRHEAAEAMRLK